MSLDYVRRFEVGDRCTYDFFKKDKHIPGTIIAEHDDGGRIFYDFQTEKQGKVFYRVSPNRFTPIGENKNEKETEMSETREEVQAYSVFELIIINKKAKKIVHQQKVINTCKDCAIKQSYVDLATTIFKGADIKDFHVDAITITSFIG